MTRTTNNTAETNKPGRKRLILIGLVLAAIAVGATTLMMARKPQPAAGTGATVAANAGGKNPVAGTAGGSASAPAGIAVELVAPSRVNWPVSLVANGALAAWQEATISAETGGLRIVALHADVGSRVKRGQLLAELNDETVKADLRKTEAAVAAAQARLREAQANVKRANAVRESGSLSGQQIEQYEIAGQTAGADLQSVQADLAGARIRLNQSRIVAVDDGVISARSASLGAVVASGAELFVLVRDERIEWRAEVDALQLAQLKRGQAVSVSLPGGGTVDGKVRQLAPTLDTKTRTGLAYVDLPRDARLRAGTYVRGEVALGEHEATVLPSSTVTLRDGRSYVFEVDRRRNVVIQHEVTTGRTRGDRTEILAGIEPGVTVVKSGGAFLNDGDGVRIDAPAPSAGGAGGANEAGNAGDVNGAGGPGKDIPAAAPPGAGQAAIREPA